MECTYGTALVLVAYLYKGSLCVHWPACTCMYRLAVAQVCLRLLIMDIDLCVSFNKEGAQCVVYGSVVFI